MSSLQLRLMRASAPLVCAVAAASAASMVRAAEKGSTEVGEVVVTGSLIRRPELLSEQPMQVVSGELQDTRGYTTVAELLNNLPVSGVPESPRGAQGDNVGRNYVDLFNLGSQRTLTLVNGRRFVSSNPATSNTVGAGSQVDLNNIPSGMIARVDVVEATGAATYGSDAIAGVVNIILRDNMQGLHADAQYGISDRNDAPMRKFSLTGGMNFAGDRGNVTASYEHTSTGGLLNSDRPSFALGYSFFNNPANKTATDGIPGQILLCCRTQSYITLGGLPLAKSASGAVLTMPDPSHPGQTVLAQFASGGNLVPYNPGTFLSPVNTINGDGWNTAFFMNLLAPVERDVVYGEAHYDITDHIKAFAELSGSWVRAKESARQAGVVNSFENGGINGLIPLSIDNPFLTAQARGIIAGDGLSNFFLSRYSADVVPEGNGRLSKNDTTRGVVGLSGDLNFGGHNFYWTAFGNFGLSTGYVSFVDVNAKRFTFATDAVAGPGGVPACRITLANPGTLDRDIALCQPLNLFGVGAPSAAAINYVDALMEQFSTIRETNFQASFNGDILELPGGKLRIAGGYEYRKESTSVTGNAARVQGIGRLAPIAPLHGSYDTNEVYGEVLVPLVGRNFTLPLVKSLEFDGAYRYVDNSQAGANKAWNISGHWQPVDDVTVRGSVSHTFRAPSFVELFLPLQTNNSLIHDPCDTRFIGTGNNPSVRAANCAKLYQQIGLAPGATFTSRVADIAFPFTIGGNPGLKNELAHSWTAGLVLAPHFIPGLRLSGDYVSIDIVNTITQFNGETIARTCYDAPSPDPAICGLLTRDATGQIIAVKQGFVNAGFTRYRGVTYNATYAFPLSNISQSLPGSLTFNLAAQNVKRLETSVSGFPYDLVVTAGTFAAPHWKGQFDTTYNVGPLTLSWNVQYVGSAIADPTFTVETRSPLGAPAVWRHDLSAQYAINSKVKVRAGVYNVFDRLPPFGTTTIGLSNTNGGNVDVIGRAYFVGATADF